MRTLTTFAQAERVDFHGRIPAADALGAVDVGWAVLPDGRRVLATCGRKLTLDEARAFADSPFEPIQVEDFYEHGAWRAAFELIIPERDALAIEGLCV